MPDNREVRQPGQSTNQAQSVQQESARQIQEQLEQEMRAADNALEKRRLATSLKDAVKDAKASAGEQRRSTQLKSRGGPEASPTDREQLKKDLVRALKGVEMGVIDVPNEANKAVLVSLYHKVGAQLNGTNAAFLHPIVSDLLEGALSVEELEVHYVTLKQDWGLFGPEIVKDVSDAIVQAADEGKLSVSGDQAREMFPGAAVSQDQRGSEVDEELKVFNTDWEYYYRNFFRPEDIPVLEALYSVESMGRLVEDIHRDVSERPESRGLTQVDLDKLISSELEERIVLTYSKMFSRVDQQRPDKTFEEIEQEGSLYSSIRAVEAQFKGALELMSKNVRQSTELPESLRGLRLFRRYSIEGLREKELPIGDPSSNEKKLQLQYKVTPVAGVEPVSLADFLTGISSEIVHENSIRRYLHNVQSLFLRPAGKDGFWSQVAGYSESIKSEDIDAMMLLPDSEKSISAYRMYVKYLEEEFVKVDWIHQPNMFGDDLFKNKSKVQQRVFEDLKRMYPELGTETDSWRLQRALAMGVGLARGIFLSEAEIAAYADPHINVENGAPKFTSYFTNDNAATETLNPLHFFLRWQAESLTMGPLIYMPIDAVNKKLLRKWDHTELWKKMKQYRDSFQNGKVVFGSDPKDKTLGQLFVDILPNYAKGGSFITRGGWRMINATEGWLYDKDGHELGIFDKFKALENIGYEAVKTINPADKDLPRESKEQIFTYLANKYLAGEIRGNVWDYIKGLEGGDPEKQEKLFMNIVYSRMLFQRMPTKFVRLDRDRTSKNGKSLWKIVREEMGGDISAIKFDEAMKDLAYVEVAVRNDVSKEMREHLASQQDDAKDLSNFIPTQPYVVTEDSIRRFITDIQQQERAVSLLRSIKSVTVREKCLDTVALTLNSNKGYPFALGAEELDTSFTALRNAGSRVHARALSDTTQIEMKVTHNLKAFMGSLHHVSIDPKHDFSPLIKHIKEMKDTIESIHGHDLAGRIAQYMSTLAVAYFKKDDIAINWRTKLGTFDRVNSLAAEFAGTHRGVWEWEVSDIDAFVTSLERERIVAKNGAYDLAYQGSKVPEIQEKKFLGVKWHKIKHHEEGFESGKSLRQKLGATKADISKDMLTRTLPLVLAFMAYTIMMKAFKTQSDKK